MHSYNLVRLNKWNNCLNVFMKILNWEIMKCHSVMLIQCGNTVHLDIIVVGDVILWKIRGIVEVAKVVVHHISRLRDGNAVNVTLIYASTVSKSKELSRSKLKKRKRNNLSMYLILIGKHTLKKICQIRLLNFQLSSLVRLNYKISKLLKAIYMF